MIVTTAVAEMYSTLETGLPEVSMGGIGILIGLLGVGLLAFWWFDEREEDDRWEDTIERVGERAESVTGGFVGAFGSLVVVAVSILATIGNELVMAIGDLAGPVSMFPALVGASLIGLLGTVGLSGIVPIEAWQFGVIVLAVLILASYGVVRRRGAAA